MSETKNEGGRLVGYEECRCILTQYCDGTCRPIFDFSHLQPTGADEPSELDIEQQFVPQLPQHAAAIVPKEVRRPYRRDDDPDYFAVLEASYRSPTVPPGQPGHYFTVARDEPLANEFRVYMHQLPSMCMASIPLGSNRDRAESIVHAINKAYAFGLDRGVANPAYGRPLVGRMGHRNRDEESMP